MTKLRIAPALASLSGLATLLCMYAFSNQPYLILLSLASLGLLMLAVIRDGRYVLWYIAAFILGPIILDIPGMHFGLWSFGTPQFLGFPFWLPFLYGNSTVSFLYLALMTSGMRDRNQIDILS